MHLYTHDYKYVCMYVCMYMCMFVCLFVCFFAISFTLGEPLALLYVYSVMHIYIHKYILHTVPREYVNTYYVHAHVHICACACSNARLSTLLCHDRPTNLFFHIHHATYRLFIRHMYNQSIITHALHIGSHPLHITLYNYILLLWVSWKHNYSWHFFCWHMGIWQSI